MDRSKQENTLFQPTFDHIENNKLNRVTWSSNQWGTYQVCLQTYHLHPTMQPFSQTVDSHLHSIFLKIKVSIWTFNIPSTVQETHRQLYISGIQNAFQPIVQVNLKHILACKREMLAVVEEGETRVDACGGMK